MCVVHTNSNPKCIQFACKCNNSKCLVARLLKGDCNVGWSDDDDGEKIVRMFV